MEAPLTCLYLRTPLEYAEAPELVPFNNTFSGKDPAHFFMQKGGQELLFCFELERNEAARIDPQAHCFLGELVFAGKGDGKQGNVRLPAGKYLFVQHRRLLDRDECIHYAIEQQKDGLWERNKPENLLYIRFLFEDGSPVTQLFRPVM